MTIRSAATRLVSCSSSTVFSDSGLSNMIRDMKDIFDAEAEEDVIGKIRTSFQTTYGAPNVLENSHAERYEWYWDAGTESWKKRKIVGSTFTVDDGETNALEANVFIWSSV